MTNCFTFAAIIAVAFVLVAPEAHSSGKTCPNFFDVAAAYRFR